MLTRVTYAAHPITANIVLLAGDVGGMRVAICHSREDGSVVKAVEPDVVSELECFTTPSILNGLKRLGVSPADLQTIDRHVVRCTSPELGPRAGVAVTRVVSTRRSGSSPDAARVNELDARSAATAASIAAPKFAVVHNVGDWHGPVCIWGEVMAHIHIALGYRAGLTNGPVRDAEEMAAAGFQSFAAGLDVGGGFVDHIEVDRPVAIGGVVIHPGDILHGDRHGVVRVPADLAPELPAAIAEHESVEARVFDVCRSSDFSLDAVARAFGATDGHA